MEIVPIKRRPGQGMASMNRDVCCDDEEGAMKQRPTMQGFRAAPRGEITSGDATRELVPYREAPLVVPRTRWTFVLRPRRWHAVAALVGCVAYHILDTEWSWVLTAAALLLAIVPLRLVRVPVTSPTDRSIATCGCDRCSHGRLTCDPCEECGRPGRM